MSGKCSRGDGEKAVCLGYCARCYNYIWRWKNRKTLRQCVEHKRKLAFREGLLEEVAGPKFVTLRHRRKAAG